MRIRFLADADLNQIIVAAVLRRLPEADFRTARDAGLAGLHDKDVLALAPRGGSVRRHFGAQGQCWDLVVADRAYLTLTTTLPFARPVST